MSKILLTIKAPLLCGVLIMSIFNCYTATAQVDTLHVLAYSVLYIGDTPPCQAPHDVLENYLKTVISYTNADIVGLEKREPEGSGGTAPVGFADSLLVNSFNAAYPGRFAYCTYTNVSAADNITTLYYNQQKLGYAGLLCTYSNITDFDTWKLYYKTLNLASTHDTTFLYVTLNHTSSGSGSGSATTRAAQIAGEMTQIETHFTSLPNMINMGDFNVHTSTEACYQNLVAPSNLNYRYYDPPFYPDATYSYPADWDVDPNSYASSLTVSTRTGSLPNTCSSNNSGGWSWYDHIFLSANIINNADHVSYMPHSFRVIGNDGNRLSKAVNASPTNTSAPSVVINAIYQLSEHYPVALDLLVDTSATSISVIKNEKEKVTVANPIETQLVMWFTKDLIGKTIDINCIDVLGRSQMKNSFVANNDMMLLPCTLLPGIYYINVSTNNIRLADIVVTKK